MKPWKVLFGLGGACAACCALPLFGGVAALGASSSVLLACIDELERAGWAAVAVAFVAGGLSLWQRRQAGKKAD